MSLQPGPDDPTDDSALRPTPPEPEAGAESALIPAAPEPEAPEPAAQPGPADAGTAAPQPGPDAWAPPPASDWGTPKASEWSAPPPPAPEWSAPPPPAPAPQAWSAPPSPAPEWPAPPPPAPGYSMGEPSSAGWPPPPPSGPPTQAGGSYPPPPPPSGYAQPPGSWGAQPGAGSYPPGYPPPGYQALGYGAPPQTDGKAVVGLILAIASWVVCPVILAVIALVVAGQSNRTIETSGGRLEGRSLNTATKWVAWINIVLSVLATIALIIFFGWAVTQDPEILNDLSDPSTQF